MSRRKPKKPKLRVVFDTNAFSPGAFELLESSPFRKLCKIGRIVPIYSHVFIEETLRAYGSPEKRDHLINKWLPLIIETCERICEDFVTIWHAELVRARGPHTPIFMSGEQYERFKNAVVSIPPDGSWRVWHASKPELDLEQVKKDAQREISKEIRKEVADWRKQVRYNPRKHGAPPSFSAFLRSEIEQGGKAFLLAKLKVKHAAAVYDRWSRNKFYYPYFTQFVINMLYIALHAATKPNDPIDANAQADLDLMTHLLRADAVVSNESGFLSQAFEDLWKTRGKVLFTSAEFRTFLEKVVA